MTTSWLRSTTLLGRADKLLFTSMVPSFDAAPGWQFTKYPLHHGI